MDEQYNKIAIFSDRAPQPRGLYSQAIKLGNLVFLSGQLPLNPYTNELINDTPLEAYRQCFKNLESVCIAAGGNLNLLVKLTVYLNDINISPLLDEVMSEFFSKPYPARSRVFVNNLSMNSPVEIEGIMCI